MAGEVRLKFEEIGVCRWWGGEVGKGGREREEDRLVFFINNFPRFSTLVSVSSMFASLASTSTPGPSPPSNHTDVLL